MCAITFQGAIELAEPLDQVMDRTPELVHLFGGGLQLGGVVAQEGADEVGEDEIDGCGLLKLDVGSALGEETGEIELGIGIDQGREELVELLSEKGIGRLSLRRA